MLNPNSVFDCFEHVLASCLSNCGDLTSKERSSYFVTNLCEKLDELINFNREYTSRHVTFNQGGKNDSGEWLLDGTWTSDNNSLGTRDALPFQIRCALECESSTSTKDFFWDFMKLVVVSADIKIFAAGLNQKTVEGADNYVSRRVAEVQDLLNESNDREKGNHTDWFLGFWPSPLNKDGQSLWNQLETDSYRHLNSIRLYHRDRSSFNLIDRPTQ